MSKRLAVLHRIGVRVEEVTDRWHDFVADGRVEVSELHRMVAVADLAIQLRHGQPVVLARVPAAESGRRLVVEVAVEAAGGGEDRIATVEEVDTTAPVGPAVLQIEDLLVDEIELIDLAHPVAVIERDRAVERRAPVVAADAGVDPAVGGDAALLEKLRLEVAGRALVDLLGRLLRRQAAQLVGVFLGHIGRHGGKAAGRLTEGGGSHQRGSSGQARSKEGQLRPVELHESFSSRWGCCGRPCPNGGPPVHPESPLRPARQVPDADSAIPTQRYRLALTRKTGWTVPSRKVFLTGSRRGKLCRLCCPRGHRWQILRPPDWQQGAGTGRRPASGGANPRRPDGISRRRQTPLRGGPRRSVRGRRARGRRPLPRARRTSPAGRIAP